MRYIHLKEKQKIFYLGFTSKPIYKHAAHALRAVISYGSLGAKARKKKPINKFGKLRSQNHARQNKFKKLWNYWQSSSYLTPLFCLNSLIGWLDFTAGFLYPVNCSAMHHRVRKSSSATAITKVSKTGESFNATWRSPWADFVSRSFSCTQRSAWTCLKSSCFGGSQGSACAGPVSC